jgi:uncharacterized protein YcnI
MYRLLRRAGIAAALVTPAFAAVATAHVTLERREAVAGTNYKAVLRVPHGCDGSPTRSIRVEIPAGVDNVKPMPHAGWQLSTVKAKRKSDDGSIAETVVEVAWTGGSLPNDYYDEFVFRAALPDAPGTVIYFPVLQTCESGTHHWAATPATPRQAGSEPDPAPALKLLPRPAR